MTGAGSVKIQFLLPGFGLGGSENHVLELAAGLRKRGHETGITTVFKEGELAGEVKKREIPFTCLESKGWGPRTFVKVFDWIRSNRMDVLHTYLFGFHFFAVLSARLLRIPAIVSSRREIAHWQKGKHLFVENLGNLFVDRVVCCSRAAQQWTLSKEKIQPFKTLTIYNGVDTDRFSRAMNRNKVREMLGIPTDAQVVGTVANFSHEKGYPYLLQAIRSVLNDKPGTWFLLAGSGPLLEETRRELEKITHGGQIVLTGFRRDIPELMSAMDIFVLASISEGFPNVLLEAMSMEKPVVATEVGGIPELISPGEDGVLVSPKDGKALAGALLGLLEDPSRAGRLGKKAREKIIRDFSLRKMVDRYEDFYLSLISSQLGRAKELICAE